MRKLLSFAFFFTLMFSGYSYGENDMAFKVYVKSADVNVESLDPARAKYFREQLLLSNLTESLLKIDGNGQIKGNIAKEWSISNDGQVISFVIDQSFKSSSGNNVSSEDVSLSLKRLCILRKNTHFAIYDFLKGADKIKNIEDDIEGVKVLDKSKIVLSFNTKIHDILIKLAHQEFSILPKAAISESIYKINWEKTYGPYYISKIDNDKTVLTINSYYKYFDSDSLKKVWVLNTMEVDNRVDLVEQVNLGKIHFLDQSLPLNYNVDNLKSYENVEVFPREFVYVCFLSLNPNDKSFKDQAIRADLRNRIFSSNFPDNNFFIKKAFNIFPQGLLGSEIDKKPFLKTSFNKNINLQITLANGYKDQLEGLLRSKLSEVGINVSFDYRDYKLVDKAVLDSNYQSALALSGTNARFPDAFFKFFIKSNWISDPTGKLEKMYIDIVQAKDYNEKAKLVVETTKHLIEQGTLIPLYFQKIPFFLNKNYKISDLESFNESILFKKIKKSNNG